MICRNSYLFDWSKDHILYTIKKLNNWKDVSVFIVTKGAYDYTQLKKLGVKKLREIFENYYSRMLCEYIEVENEE